jgi:ketosteroid isomerase-like protein
VPAFSDATVISLNARLVCWPYLQLKKLVSSFRARKAENNLNNRILYAPEEKPVKALFASAVVLVILACSATFAQNAAKDEGGRVLGLENAWNHAIEAKDTKGLDMLLASTFVAVEIDGSISSKSEFLASIKDPEYKPSQAVNEQVNVQVYGDATIVVGIFRIKGIEKGKPYVHRERFTDTWIKHDQTWQCVASHSTLIPSK